MGLGRPVAGPWIGPIGKSKGNQAVVGRPDHGEDGFRTPQKPDAPGHPT